MINASDVRVIPLSNFNWTPVLLESNYNTFQVNQQLIEFTNGVKFNIAPIYAEIKDIAVNNNSFLMLSKHLPVNNIFKEKNILHNKPTSIKYTALKVEKLVPAVTSTEFIKTPKTGSTVEITKTHSTETHKYTYLTTKNNTIGNVQKTVFLKTELFSLNFVEDYVTINSADGRYICDGGSYIYPNTTPDKFNYILNDFSIILFKYNTNYTKVLTYNSYANTYSFTTLLTGDSIPEQSIFYIEQYKNKYNDQTSITNSFFAKYSTDALSANNSIDIDKESKNLIYNQNYLINIPIHSDNTNYTAYINSLKNYQTPNYNYSLINDEPKRREYTNLFAGNNQKNGYNNIYLNYTSNTIEKLFKKDEVTTFHCPATLPTSGIPLSSVGMYEDGAIAGKNPFTSDRISYSRRDYRELGIPQVSSVIADNTWLYSWLSAGNTGSPVWVDRFYTGTQFDITGTEYLAHNENNPLIVDIPSTMMLLPYRVYEYFHQGKNNIKKYIENFNYIDRDGTTTLLEVDDWSSNVLFDKSSHKSSGVLSLNTQALSAEYLQLNGKNYALFPATTISDNQQLTLGFWYNVDNWKDVEGTQIIGNYSNSGIGLFNKQTTPTSFITVYDNINGYIYNYNNNFKILNEQIVTDTNNTSVHIMRTTDQDYWLIRKINSHIYATKYDLNNNVAVGPIQLEDIQYISQVEFDSLENIYVYDSTSKILVVFDGYTGYIINKRTFDNSFNRIELIKDYTGSRPVVFLNPTSATSVISVNAHHSTTDNNKNIWSSVGVNLYKNTDFYATVGNIIQITCDIYSNIWILHDIDKVTKINTKNNVIDFSIKINSTIFDTSVDIQKRFINFISIKNNNVETSYAIIIDNQEKAGYIVDMKGEINSRINLLSIPSTFLSKKNFNRESINFTAYGDFTGYQYQRKFNTSYELVWKVATTQSSNTTKTQNTEVFNLPFSTEAFNPGWHYFSLVFDHAKGYIAAYTDGIVVNQQKFDPFKYKIKQSYKPLSIGAITTEQGILNDTIGINTLHKTIGKIAHLHIYKYAFDKYDINSLFKGTYLDLYQDMTWNIQAGQRNYIEQIERFFMHKMPGNKSKYYNIKIKNLTANSSQQKLIEQAIKSTIQKITPADTTLYKIKWD